LDKARCVCVHIRERARGISCASTRAAYRVRARACASARAAYMTAGCVLQGRRRRGRQRP
jgi:hypothetical protein